MLTALPTVFVHDGSVLVDPTDAKIMDAVGESPAELLCDVAVVGAGPASLTAASASSLIRNYLGFPRGISGADLTQRAHRVTLVVRGNSLNKDMSDYLVNQIRATANIEVRVDTEVIGGDGRDRLERIAVRDKARNVVDNVPAELLFALIGATPQTAVGESAGAVQNIHQYIEEGLRAAKGKRPAALRIGPSLASAEVTNSAAQARSARAAK
jgi:thioredoxin reductase